MAAKPHSNVKLRDMVEGTNAIKQTKPGAWELKQRRLGTKKEIYVEDQTPTWVRIENPGRRRKIEIALHWAAGQWPHWRQFGYQKVAGEYCAVRGEAEAQTTRFRIGIPSGVSEFGAFPWYSNEDAAAFLESAAQNPACRVRTVGETATGRPLQCLTLGKNGKQAPNVVVFARVHGTESSGSFAVEGVADFLLNDRKGKALLSKYAFHLFPTANPDGVAQGLKFPQWGPKEKYDLSFHFTASPDKTAAALREELDRLRPVCLLDYHSYFNPVPGLFFFEEKFGLSVLREMIRTREGESKFFAQWMDPRTAFRKNMLKTYCRLEFGTSAVVAEVPWNFGLLPADVSQLGTDIFKAAMKSLPKR